MQMKTNRRQFIKGLGVVSTGSIGLAGTGTAVASSPNDVHPKDRFSVTKERFRNNSLLQELVKNPLHKMKKGEDRVYIYIDKIYAQENYDSVTSIDGSRSISEQLLESEQWREAERVRKMVEKKKEKEMQASIQEAFNNDSEVGIQSVDTIELGQDTTLSANNKHDSGTTSVFGDKKAEVRIGSDQLHCEVVGTIGQVGTATAWAWVGDEFEVTGSGDNNCTITPSTYYSGTLWAAAAADSRVKINFTLNNLDGPEEWDEVILDEVVTGVGELNLIDTRNDSINVNLNSGDRYRLKVKCEVSSTVAVEGGSTADFGENLDSNHLPDEYVDQKYYDFNF